MAWVFLCGAMGAISFTAHAADRGGIAAVVEKEIAKRNVLMQEARAQITEGELLYARGDYALSASTFRQAWDLLPDSPITASIRAEARDGFSRAAVAYAEKLAADGKYPQSRELLNTVLAENFNPEYKDAKVLLKRLDDPDRYEPALTPEHVANVAKVERELRMGASLTNLGDYEGAILHYKIVLRIDPYNEAARRAMERVEQLKSEYYDTARDHTRAKWLASVDREWEDPVPVIDVSAFFGAGATTMGAIGGSKESMLLKMRSMILPVVDLQAASLEEVVEFLRIRTRELDPTKRGVSFVLKVSPDIAARPITLSMVGMPVEEVLRYATEITSTTYRADEYAVTITSRADKSDAMISKSYKVPPGFLENAPAGALGAPVLAPANPFATNTAAPTGLQIRRLGAKEFLEQRGVIFPEGSIASYSATSGVLTVRNTAENLAIVDGLVEDATSKAPKQVEIQVKMLEVSQNNYNELGFDWLLGQFGIAGNRVFGSGGEVGNQGNNLSTEAPINMASGFPVGQNPITAGLRSSGEVFGVPSIDQLIGTIRTPSPDSRSPATFALAGVFTDPQFQVIVRAVSQAKGVDILASPTVRAKGGQRASISVVREFIYPTEYDPPQIPQNIGQNSTTLINGQTGSVTSSQSAYTLPTTPSTPTAFEKRDVGVTLETEAVVSDDGKTIDLNIVPVFTEFEGFIDYGQDFKSYSVGQSFNLGAFTTSNSVTYFDVDNPILQPVFRTNKVNTNVSIYDGETVMLGGVMYEKETATDDKVPILGDLPIIGRSFQAKVRNREKKNIIFFVTVRVVDPGGNPYNQAAATGPVTAGAGQ